MSDASEKPFSATPTKIAKARREGNIARSQELPANAAFVTALIAVSAIAAPFSGLARAAIADAARGSSTTAALTAMAGCGVLVIAAGAVGALAASVAQTGGLLIVAPSMKFSRLVPLEGMKRMLSRDAATHAARAACAFVVAGVAMIAAMRAIFATAVHSTDALGVATVAWRGSQQVAWAAAAVGAVFAAIEYGVARKAWLAKLKMTLHELKRELKENDGDPMARSRRKAMHRGMIRGAIAKVKDAAFVVVNPTHVAVALEYRPPDIPVPVVLVRAADEMALRVREIAADAGIPVIENIPLARALFAHADVGDPIPAEQYVAVAEIVAQLVRSGALE